ncbi:hypothetical protein DsansV1_C21g0166831 [Dioscorea sansibarensis]
MEYSRSDIHLSCSIAFKVDQEHCYPFLQSEAKENESKEEGKKKGHFAPSIGATRVHCHSSRQSSFVCSKSWCHILMPFQADPNTYHFEAETKAPPASPTQAFAELPELLSML